jgi:hypothetical protein
VEIIRQVKQSVKINNVQQVEPFHRPMNQQTDNPIIRSGKQNIVEGSKASGTFKGGGDQATNVARASLEELLEDYRDYLRVRDLAMREKDSKVAQYVI